MGNYDVNEFLGSIKEKKKNCWLHKINKFFLYYFICCLYFVYIYLLSILCQIGIIRSVKITEYALWYFQIYITYFVIIITCILSFQNLLILILKAHINKKQYIFLKECMYINNKNKFSSNINFFTALVKYMKKEISAKTPRTNLKH